MKNVHNKHICNREHEISSRRMVMCLGWVVGAWDLDQRFLTGEVAKAD